MAAEQPFLLVIDPNPEAAARVNSLLRNTGINIHVLHADNSSEAERLVRDFSPYLIYYLPDSAERFPVSEAVRIAEEHGVFLAISMIEGATALFLEAAHSFACIGIGDEDQLSELTHRLAGIGQAAREQDRLKAQEAELESRLDLLMNSTSEPIAYFHEGLHVAANDAYLEFMGIESFDELAMVSLLEILEKDATDLKALVRGFSRDEYPQAGERFRLRPPGGEPQEVDLTFAPVTYEGEHCVQLVVRSGEVRTKETVADAAAISPGPSPLAAAPQPAPPVQEPPVTGSSPAPVTQDQTSEPGVMQAPPVQELTAAQSQSGADALTDHMTGMLWRAPFMARLTERLGDIPDHQRGGVFFLRNDSATEQLDDLKVADMERYVQATANEILTCLGDDDEVCRFDDASFVIFALRADKPALKNLADKLRASIERQAQEHPGEPMPGTCSIGMVLLDPQDHDPDSTVQYAREACKLAAREGNAVLRYKPARAAGLSDDEDAHWRERLRYALNNEDFFTVQHSIMNLDGDLEGLMENRTFLREDSNDVPASDYLAAAESNQLASQIDRLIIPGLLRAVAGGKERQIIDISGNSLQDFSFPAWFQRTLQETRIPGERIVLQWPAWAAREQVRAAHRLIEELTPLGLHFSVSDFNNDPKTLELLEELPLQMVTLDQSLTNDLQGNPNCLDSIIEVVKATAGKEIMTVASDVGTSADLAMLWRGGVKLVSGQFIQETPRVIGQ